MVIRAYQPFDAVPLAALFYQTVHTVNRRDYTEKQLDAWAPKDIDLGAWDRSLQVHHTLVAVEDGCAVGFGDIDRQQHRVSGPSVCPQGPPGHGNRHRPL